MSSSSSCSVQKALQNGELSSSNVDQISSSSLDFLAKINESEPTHGLLVPSSKKRTNSNFAYTMILRGHTYHVCYRRQTPRGERVYWRCQLRGQCKARLITDLDGRIVQFTNPIHSHPSSARLNTQQQSCIQALLTKVEENIDFLNSANNTLSPPSSLPPNSSPDNEYPILSQDPINSKIFESPNTSNTSGTLSSNGEPVESKKVSRKRQQHTTKSQQTGEIDIEEILRQIPQLQTLRFDSYYNEEDDEEINNNENSDDIHQAKKLTLTETDDEEVNNTDSSSVASPSHLADSQRLYLLKSLLQNSWSSSNNERESIRKSFEFSDFNEAFGFMNRVAMKAEVIHRHPEWKNAYNKVHVTLPMNSDQTILTIADLNLAKFMDEIYHR